MATTITITITITSISISYLNEGEGGAFSGGVGELRLPEDCTIDQAIAALERLKR